MIIYSITPLQFTNNYHMYIDKIVKNDVYVIEHEFVSIKTGQAKTNRAYLISEELFLKHFK